MDATARAASGTDERAHPVGAGRLWSESWYVDFADTNARTGGFVRVGLYPNLGLSWWWAYVVVPHADRSLTAGRHVERPLVPEREPPFRLDDPDLALAVSRDRRGVWRLEAEGAGFALDLEWAPAREPYRYARGDRYEQPGWAVGTVRAGGERHAVDGPGQSDHSWGIRDWWRFGWDWCAGWLEGGDRFQVTQLQARGRVDPDGYVTVQGGGPVPVRKVSVTPSPAGAGIDAGGRRLELHDAATVDVDLAGPDGRYTMLRRSLVRVCAPDGRTGAGWRECNVPSAARRRPRD